jgi:hypothetical protein
VAGFLDALVPVWDIVKDIEDQKAFALALQQHVPSNATALFFLARKSGTTPHQAWLALPFNKQVSMADRVVSL